MLSRQLLRSIVYYHVPRRAAFDKTNYVDYHVPWNYKRPPRQAKWDDPNYTWPPTVAAYTKHSGRHLIHELEAEYMRQAKPKFPIPNFRTGDELELETFYSISSQKFSTFKGLCIAKRRWKMSLPNWYCARRSRVYSWSATKVNRTTPEDCRVA